MCANRVGEHKQETRIQAKNRAAIKRAALKVFSENGFLGSTLDQIAAACSMSKPNVLYYFSGKEAIHRALLEELLDNWLAPLRHMDPDGEPISEILAYVDRKLQMAQEFPMESRLFANEILQGAPRIEDFIRHDLKDLVDEKAAVISGWVEAGKIAQVDPYHLIFSIWAMTQHYADFEIQVRLILPDGTDPYEGASTYLHTLFVSLLTP